MDAIIAHVAEQNVVRVMRFGSVLLPADLGIFQRPHDHLMAPADLDNVAPGHHWLGIAREGRGGW